MAEHVCEHSGIMVTRDATKHFQNAWCTVCGKSRYEDRVDVVGSLWLKGEPEGVDETDEVEEE